MYKNILFATDLTQEHYHLAQKAAEFAKQIHAKLFLLHVIELPASIQLAQGLGFAELANPKTEDAKTVLAAMGDSIGIPKDQQMVEIGSVREHIINKVQQLNCQLILMGSHTPSGLPAFLGSTAHAVINHAPCDVLTLQS